MLADQSTDILVHQWSYWARDNHDRLGYPKLSAFASQMDRPGRATLVINDDTALVLDQIITRLCHRDESLGRALATYHFYGRNISRASEHLGCDRRVTNTLVKAGTAWVDSALDFMSLA